MSLPERPSTQPIELVGHSAPHRRIRQLTDAGVEVLVEVSCLDRSLPGNRERTRARAAEQQAHEARLRALQSQLEPHFLFNALNAVCCSWRSTRSTGVEAAGNYVTLPGGYRHVLDRFADGLA